MKPHARSLLVYMYKLIHPYWKMVLFGVAMGAINSISAVYLISIITRQLHGEEITLSVLVQFAAIFVLMLATEMASGVGTGLVGQNVISDMRKYLSSKVLAASIQELEGIQSPRIMAVLERDVTTLSGFSRGISYLIVATCEVLGGTIYLIHISIPMFIVSITVWSANYLLTLRVIRNAYSSLSAERKIYDDLQILYCALIDGAKELKLSRERRSQLFDSQLLVTIDRLRDLSNHCFTRFVASGALDNASFFIIAGAIIVFAQMFVDSQTNISGFVLTLLYLRSPLGTIVRSLPMSARAAVSCEAIRQLSEQLNGLEADLAEPADNSSFGELEQLELRSVSYLFSPVINPKPFRLGPIDLMINSGEVLFITGENGSGKTTLVKLILGLYPPTMGEIRFNGKVVTKNNRDNYRQKFSAIFFDFYLFKELIVTDEVSLTMARSYLERLELAHKVTVDSGLFSTVELSAGQRKRLALIGTFLEQRQIIVFDEWAAEQDPTFRRIFYTEILHNLKQQGKTLIVVSHDDRYFEAADRIIHIHNGRISVNTPQPKARRPNK